MMRFAESQITYKVAKQVGVLSEDTRGWRKELNMVSWNEAMPRLEIRCWSPDHSRMGKGLAFTREELATLAGILLRMEDIRPLIDMETDMDISQ